MNTPSASVLIIENHPLMREALCAAIALEPDLVILEPAAQSTLLVLDIRPDRLFLADKPDLILLALGNPGLNEMQTLAVLRQSLPETPILALTSNEVPGQEQAALAAGAHAVLTKAVQRTHLVEKLRELRTNLQRNYSESFLPFGETSRKL